MRRRAAAAAADGGEKREEKRKGKRQRIIPHPCNEMCVFTAAGTRRGYQREVMG